MTRATYVFGAAFAFLAVCSGCRDRTREHSGAASASASGAHAVVPAGTANAKIVSLEAAIASADLRVEARRGLAVESEPLLVRHRARLDAHFGAPSPFPLAFQAIAVEGGKSALLLEATRGERRPLAWLLDAHGDIVWAKDHPMGGVKPGVSEPALTPGPDGHVCLAWCNASTDSIALRRWAEDGGAFADYDALHVDECEALSVLYWPRRGWILGIAGRNGATLELINENGERAWGNDGISLPWTWSTAAPVSLALDTLESMFLFRLGRSGAAGSGEYVFASRWSPDGRPMWPGPLSVKQLPGKITDPRARLVLSPGKEGAIEATLPEGVAGARVFVEVQSDGSVARR
jgi:hypothetical protein